MTSVDLEKEHLEEPQPPKKKPRIDESNQAAENAKFLEREDRVSEIPTKTMDMPTAVLHSRPLPLELNCEIFKCLKLPVQRKFIWGLGRGIYGMFRHKLLVKTKRLYNPKPNYWNPSNKHVDIYGDGLCVSAIVDYLRSKKYWHVYAEQRFPIGVEMCRQDGFPGTIVYYFEVTQMASSETWDVYYVGLSNKSISHRKGKRVDYANSFVLEIGYDEYECRLAGKKHNWEWPEGATRPEWSDGEDVFGCGLVLSPDNKWAIFFTMNGLLFDKTIDIYRQANSNQRSVGGFPLSICLGTNSGHSFGSQFRQRYTRAIQIRSTRQHQIELPMPTEQQMKMRIHFLQHSLRLIRRHFIGQLPLENWVDLFGFVPRRQLVQLLPQIDDRHFAEALQYFLQKVGKISLGYLTIVPPAGNDVNGGPMVYKESAARLDLADTQMPGNIKNFRSIDLSYLDISVVNFLCHFQQNSLLQNVNLLLWLWNTSNEKLLPFLTHVLPLIDSIESIRMVGIPQFIQICDSPPPAENNNEFLQNLLNTMMAQPRILKISKYYSDLEPAELDWCCKWLYNTPRNDGRPRLLIISAIYSPNDISTIVDRVKQDFVSANHPISFFVTIYIYNSNTFQWPHQDISLENGRTNEKMVVRKAQTPLARIEQQMLISRHPHEASKQWIEQSERKRFWISILMGRIGKFY